MRQYKEKYYSGITNTALGTSGLTLPEFVEGNDANNLYNDSPIPGFTWGETQEETEFSQIISKRSIIPMAIGTDFDSPVQPFAKQAIKLQGGTIPRFKTFDTWNEQDIRKARNIAKLQGDAAFERWAQDDLYLSNANHFTSHWNRQVWLRHQLVSKGEAVLDKSNNPYGVSDVYVTGNIPSSNIETYTAARRWWTDTIGGTEGANSDIPGDLSKKVTDVRRSMMIRNMHFEVEYETAFAIANHSSVINAIAIRLYTSASQASWATGAVGQLPWQDRLSQLGDIIGAPIQIIDHLAAVETFNKTAKAIENKEIVSFDPNVVVLVPDGNIGTIVPLVPIPLGEPDHFATFFGGRGKVSQEWMERKTIEYIEYELTATPVLSLPQYMFYIDFMGSAGIVGVSSPLIHAPASALLDADGIPESLQKETVTKATKASKTEE